MCGTSVGTWWEGGHHVANLFQITPRKSSLFKQILGLEGGLREGYQEQPQMLSVAELGKAGSEIQ